ncbi:MFS general substrate transporter [Xylona heveae TC161]|uniref:MFS general substrate transporter n=1 Tax=Xylona heveae (strain CBS 132557 / TC161) TaxID=1328760 RepID=A0A165J6X5_XYLHT|nr:MFS general substrate transporter [Xylona heveae TC161]KZF25820.1 MFS general substrate transporter [Xylona heveae TC161]
MSSAVGGHVNSRGSAVLAVTIVTIAVASLFVFLRLFSRSVIVHRISWDDYFIFIAWIFACGFSISVCYGASVGLGRHESDILQQWQTPLKKAIYTCTVLYNPALMATKMSILLFYLTLSKTQTLFRWASIVTLVVVDVAGTALTFLNIFQCRPVSASWHDVGVGNSKCIDIVTLWLSSAPVNIITDLAILFLPMPILTGMRIPRKQKTILVITFGLGAFVTVVDVVRIANLQSASMTRLLEIASQGHSTSAEVETDFSWYASLSFMWCAIEINVGLLIANVPGLKPLVTRIMPRMLKDSADASTLNASQSSALAVPDLALPPPSIVNPAAVHSADPASIVNPARVHPQLDPTECDAPSPTDSEEPMGMMDFLTTPGDMPDLANSTTAATAGGTLRLSEAARPTFFDFVNLRNPKSMVFMSNRESLISLSVVTILFFLWGFAYGLLDILNKQFQAVGRISNGEFMGCHAAYFGAYLIGPLTIGRTVLKKWGFKPTFVSGLCIYSCGTLIFWPSAVLASFPAFIISNFIVGLGVSILEVAANPFIALCGPPEYAEVRLNISQGIQAIGSVVSPLLAQKVLFKRVLDAPSLIDVQWTYLGISLFTCLLAVAFIYFPLPEASDQDLEAIAFKRAGINATKFAGVPIIYWTLALGVFSQFCYVGAQESVSMSVTNFVSIDGRRSVGTNLSPDDIQAIGHTVFAVGRFLGALATIIVNPRWVLMFCYIGAIICSALVMNQRNDAGIAVLMLVHFFEAAIFSLIYAICLRGLGARTKTGAAFITAAVCGGAVFPPIQMPLAVHRGIPYTFSVVVALFAFGSIFPLYLNLVPAAKRQVDPRLSEDDETSSTRRPSLLSARRASRFFQATALKWKKRLSDTPVSEHVEKQNSQS